MSNPTNPGEPMLEDSLMDQLVPTTVLPAVGAHTAELDPVRDVDDLADDIDRSEEDFLPPPRTRMGRLTILLVAGLIAGLGVLGGVLIQKHEAPSTARGAAGGAAARARFGGTGTGTGTTGGFGGFGAFGGTGATGGTGTGTAGGAGSTGTGTATTAPPVAVGTVTAISGRTITLKNLGGKSVTVQLTATTTVTATGSAALATGATIAVTGTVAADGTVTAATVKQTG